MNVSHYNAFKTLYTSIRGLLTLCYNWFLMHVSPSSSPTRSFDDKNCILFLSVLSALHKRRCWLNESMERCTNMDGQMDGQTNRWMDRPTNGWMGGWAVSSPSVHVSPDLNSAHPLWAQACPRPNNYLSDYSSEQ